MIENIKDKPILDNLVRLFRENELHRKEYLRLDVLRNQHLQKMDETEQQMRKLREKLTK